jgi:hypothetical protein
MRDHRTHSPYRRCRLIANDQLATDVVQSFAVSRGTATAVGTWMRESSSQRGCSRVQVGTGILVRYDTPLSGDFWPVVAAASAWAFARVWRRAWIPLGGQNGDGLSAVNIAKPDQTASRSICSAPRISERADIDLMRPPVAVEFLTPEQIHEFLAACVGRPTNRWSTTPSNGLSTTFPPISSRPIRMAIRTLR